MTDDAFEVEEEFLLIGRTYAEYAAMFGLDSPAGPVLDCGSGVGSFVAEARECGVAAVGADPAYTADRATLRERAADARARNTEQLREKRDAFVWDFYGDPATRADYLRRANERFLADYPAGPYVAAGLPALPFRDGAFGLALSANLLFLYDDRLSLEFHVDALSELARVADEARVFPLASLDRTRSEYVEPCLARLRERGHDPALREVDYEFQPGATTTLVV
ncbi:class I SAM-dependent methyltransferase [Halosegnis marinus]|uniref:Class I SAM-dependent methyltransferase n=1 Tax=Halosegnis marinus TaxID=3034023 RepID=A0ABD5ZSB9_9EURY|nr:class I SAM-dependent methyltransferase [Halosegnis sp. DT85]